MSEEFQIASGHHHGDLSSSLHKRVHPYPVSEPGRHFEPVLCKILQVLIIIELSRECKVG